MSRNRDFDDVDDDDEDEDRQPLEGDKLVRDLRKQLKARDKRLGEVEKELSDYAKERRTRTVAEVLKAREVNEKYARFVTADIEDVTPEAVNKWLDDNADLVGVEKQESTVDEGTQESLRRINNADRNSKGPDADPIAAKLSDPNLTPEALAELIGKPLG